MTFQPLSPRHMRPCGNDSGAVSGTWPIHEPDSDLGPSLSTLDSLPFGDEGPKMLLRRGHMEDVESFLTITKEAKDADDAPYLFDELNETFLTAVFDRLGCCMVADVGEELPIGYAMVLGGTPDDPCFSVLPEVDEATVERAVRVTPPVLRPEWRSPELIYGLIASVLELTDIKRFKVAVMRVPAVHEDTLKAARDLGFRIIHTLDDAHDAEEHILRFDL